MHHALGRDHVVPGWWRISEQAGHVGFGVVREAGEQRIDDGVGFHFRGIEEEFVLPDQSHVLTEVDNVLEEALEDVNAEALPDAGQAGVIRHVFIQRVAEGVSGGPG